MTTTKAKTGRDYPITITLPDNSQANLRRMTADDLDRIVQFARALPEDDLLFLRIDITDRDAVKRWLQHQQAGQSLTLIAEVNGEIAGYGALIYNETNWQRHLGEIRLNASPRYRGRGLGRALAAELFALAQALGLRKVIAQMTADQRGAFATFERLGFQPEALLQDFVIDREGRTRDLVLMSLDLDGLTDRVD